MAPFYRGFVVALFVSFLWVAGCGSSDDLTSRGIESQPEESVPLDSAVLAETEEERRKSNARALQDAEREAAE